MIANTEATTDNTWYTTNPKRVQAIFKRLSITKSENVFNTLTKELETLKCSKEDWLSWLSQ